MSSLTNGFKNPLKSSLEYHDSIKKAARSRYLPRRPRDRLPREASLPAPDFRLTDTFVTKDSRQGQRFRHGGSTLGLLIGKLEQSFGSPELVRGLREAAQLMTGSLETLERQLAEQQIACGRLRE